MSKKIINVGIQSNDGTGDSIRGAFDKANQNFDELYSIAGAGTGLFFTKNLEDTPRTLIADTITNASSIIGVNNVGNSLTNKLLIASTGISIVSTGSNIFISNTNSSLRTDNDPTLGNNLDGNGFKGIGFADPEDLQDLATKNYVDNTSFASAVNLYVSTSGNDGRSGVTAGRALAYAYRTISKACQVAEQILADSPLELGPDQKYITYGLSSNNKSKIRIINTSTAIPGNIVLKVDYTGDGTDPWNNKDIRPGQYLKGVESGAIGFIDNLSNVGNTATNQYESYDVRVLSEQAFELEEQVLYGTPVPTTNITILVESGIYDEQLPIKVPNNCSIRGDEFRRVIIRPAAGASSSPWVRTFFCRDTTFDGLTRNGNNGLAPLGQRFGYHYLTDPSNPNSTPKQNNELDVFMMNDQTILRALSAQGHGGFMVVLDPEGQILTKSPYIQNCSSISRSINEQIFAGGMYIDGCSGNLQAMPANTSTYFTGTTTISVTGLTVRQPQTPCRYIVDGISYQIDYVQGWSGSGAADLYLNPLNPGGLAFPDGIIPVNSGTGYTTATSVIFSNPQDAGGVVARGTATIVGGVITQINLTSPGSGYISPPTVSFLGANSVPANVAITTASIKTGFIGKLPSSIEIGTAGYRSALAADFTQLNDLGYGIVVTNLAFSELVSVFAYFCHVAYYANNGAQIGSSNGAIKYGDYALVSEGSDQFEVPVPVRLVNNMITTATVNSNADFWGINTINTASGTVLYIENWDYIPTSKSLLEVDHGNAVDVTGKKIGIATYTVASANTVTNTATILEVNLLTSGGQGTLQASIPDSSSVNVRGYKSFEISGIDTTTISRPATALNFTESDSIAYRVLNYDNKGLGVAVSSFDEGFRYISMIPYAPTLPSVGATTIGINPLAGSAGEGAEISDSERLFNSVIAGVSNPSKQYIFAWNDRIHTITNYTATSISSATITISPALSSSITTSSITLHAGLQANQTAEISTRISILRATGQDFVDVGTGGRETSNIPNDIYGPPRIARSSAREVTQVGRGRVFVTATDQDGNFRVGNLFSINQGTGVATISAEISLNNVVSLRLGSGDLVTKFDAQDTAMNPPGVETVPTQTALVGYIDRRLGLNVNSESAATLGSGYLDLTGLQKMKGTFQTGGWSVDMGKDYPGASSIIYNLNTGTDAFHAANMGYVDGVVQPKVNRNGDTMTGNLILDADPTTSTSLLRASTRGYIDRVRQVSTLSDVTFTSPADADLLMFSGTTLAVNTTTNRPIWNATREIINVANSATSDISLTRVGNTVNLQYRAGSLVNADVSASAAIAQSKLTLNAAATRANASGITQAELGLASFDTRFFSSTNGWISMVSTGTAQVLISSTTSNLAVWAPISQVAPSDISGNAGTATKLQTARNINGTAFDGTTAINVNLVNALTAGTYLTSGGTFDGSTARTFAVDATTSTNLANKVAARDANGDVWARIFNGTATSAYYADLAEIYASDAEYAPGTVVIFGGEKEITIANEFMDRRIAGVISTNPAHLMNASAEGQPVALQGRVPCYVTGVVHKGDMLISSYIPGVAAASPTPLLGSVIGKALGTWNSTEVGTIEVVVGRI